MFCFASHLVCSPRLLLQSIRWRGMIVRGCIVYDNTPVLVCRERRLSLRCAVYGTTVCVGHELSEGTRSNRQNDSCVCINASKKTKNKHVLLEIRTKSLPLSTPVGFGSHVSEFLHLFWYEICRYHQKPRFHQFRSKQTSCNTQWVLSFGLLAGPRRSIGRAVTF